GQLEDALLAASETIGKEWESKIMHLAICLIEQPDFRLSGAEEAVASLQLMIAHVLEPLEPQSHVQLERSNEAYERLRQLLAEDSRRKEAAQLAELLRAYAMYRYQWLLLRHANRVFSRLRDRIADAQKDVDYCRQRLTHLHKQFDPGPPPNTPHGCLLPEGCRSLEEAVQLCLQSLPAEEIQSLDQQMQSMIEQQFTALVQVCLTSSDLTMNLQAAMQQIALKYMSARLGEVDVVSLFMGRYADPERASRKVAKAFHDSEPILEAPDSPPDSVHMIAIPDGPEHEAFLNLAQSSLPNTQPFFTQS